MEFVSWALWGMGLSLLTALLFTALALVVQSPRWLARLGLSGLRLDLRLRTFTTLALAAMLLTVGFFVAGVPLEMAPRNTAVTNNNGPNVIQTATAAALAALPVTSDAAGAIEPAGPTPTPGVNAPSSGAFGGVDGEATMTPAAGGDLLLAPPADEEDASSDGEDEPPPATTTSLPAADGTPTTTATPTPTTTPTPTATATPTVTPTPIDGETAVISTQGSTLWVRRSPGGQQLSLVRDGDVVILQNGRGNQGGLIWREIRTVDGTLGWVQEEFLAFDDES